MKIIGLNFLLLVLLFSCNNNANVAQEQNLTKWKQEIMDVEHAFAQLVLEKGIPEGFLAFAAEDMATRKNGKLIEGRQALKAFYEQEEPSPNNVVLSWEPDFIDVAASGDLAYTYGPYLYTITDTLGNVRENKGYFHTVWKRQSNGEWKFVWD